jgi:hypothetical protein
MAQARATGNIWQDRARTVPTASPAAPLNAVPEPLPFGLSPHTARVVETFWPVEKRRPAVWNSERPFCPMVFQVQDLHGDYAAQKNLADIIRSLASTKDPSAPPLLVAVEGAWGPLDTTPYHHLPDRVHRDAVAEDLLKQGLLTGEEYLAITGDDVRLRLVGVDDESLHRANTRARDESVALRKRGLKILADLQSRLDALKERLYTPALKSLDTLLRGSQEDRLTPLEIANGLETLTPGLITMDQYPQLTALRDLPASETVPQAQTRAAQLSPEAIMAELDRALAEGERRLCAGSADIQNLARWSRHIEMARSAYGLALSHSQWDDWCRYKRGDWDNLLRGLTALEHSFPLHRPRDLYRLNVLNRGDRAARRFYHLAEARNEAMAANMLHAARRHRADRLALVAGGFHTPGLKDFLRRSGSSYAVVAPSLTPTQASLRSASLFNNAIPALGRYFHPPPPSSPHLSSSRNKFVPMALAAVLVFGVFLAYVFFNHVPSIEPIPFADQGNIVLMGSLGGQGALGAWGWNLLSRLVRFKRRPARGDNVRNLIAEESMAPLLKRVRDSIDDPKELLDICSFHYWFPPRISSLIIRLELEERTKVLKSLSEIPSKTKSLDTEIKKARKQQIIRSIHESLPQAIHMQILNDLRRFRESHPKQGLTLVPPVAIKPLDQKTNSRGNIFSLFSKNRNPDPTPASPRPTPVEESSSGVLVYPEERLLRYFTHLAEQWPQVSGAFGEENIGAKLDLIIRALRNKSDDMTGIDWAISHFSGERAFLSLKKPPEDVFVKSALKILKDFEEKTFYKSAPSPSEPGTAPRGIYNLPEFIYGQPLFPTPQPDIKVQADFLNAVQTTNQPTFLHATSDNKYRLMVSLAKRFLEVPDKKICVLVSPLIIAWKEDEIERVWGDFLTPHATMGNTVILLDLEGVPSHLGKHLVKTWKDLSMHGNRPPLLIISESTTTDASWRALPPPDLKPDEFPDDTPSLNTEGEKDWEGNLVSNPTVNIATLEDKQFLGEILFLLNRGNQSDVHDAEILLLEALKQPGHSAGKILEHVLFAEPLAGELPPLDILVKMVRHFQTTTLAAMVEDHFETFPNRMENKRIEIQNQLRELQSRSKKLLQHPSNQSDTTNDYPIQEVRDIFNSAVKLGAKIKGNPFSSLVGGLNSNTILTLHHALKAFTAEADVVLETHLTAGTSSTAQRKQEKNILHFQEKYLPFFARLEEICRSERDYRLKDFRIQNLYEAFLARLDLERDVEQKILVPVTNGESAGTRQSYQARIDALLKHAYFSPSFHHLHVPQEDKEIFSHSLADSLAKRRGPPHRPFQLNLPRLNEETASEFLEAIRHIEKTNSLLIVDKDELKEFSGLTPARLAVFCNTIRALRPTHRYLNIIFISSEENTSGALLSDVNTALNALQLAPLSAASLKIMAIAALLFPMYFHPLPAKSTLLPRGTEFAVLPGPQITAAIHRHPLTVVDLDYLEKSPQAPLSGLLKSALEPGAVLVFFSRHLNAGGLEERVRDFGFEGNEIPRLVLGKETLEKHGFRGESTKLYLNHFQTMVLAEGKSIPNFPTRNPKWAILSDVRQWTLREAVDAVNLLAVDFIGRGSLDRDVLFLLAAQKSA